MPFNELDGKITEAINCFKQKLNSIDFDKANLIEFTLSDKLKDEFQNISKGRGLYFFEMQIPTSGNYIRSVVNNNFRNFNEIWRHESVFHMWSPGVKKRRCDVANKKMDSYLNGEWIPFYLGKSECLFDRINQHVFQDQNQRTFGMKLHSRENIYGLKFRVSTLEVNAQNHYKMILPYLETHFRNKLNPIIGQ
ncbi:hypothetical protein SAMN05660841_04077 [Sphingobacterium nematocida]|uniref:Uncharacterized protein n=1 Tax=Sphingobacterium nematocida TaxID=1513896 RepID=A0A1T5GHP2_9SPHI|nr:hypothetical protein [Sphingobacterium nematocida]SKC07962.1 hypothetical protein SAMN05660841_04077 [Sphingobacterium nematocida]